MRVLNMEAGNLFTMLLLLFAVILKATGLFPSFSALVLFVAIGYTLYNIARHSFNTYAQVSLKVSRTKAIGSPITVWEKVKATIKIITSSSQFWISTATIIAAVVPVISKYTDISSFAEMLKAAFDGNWHLFATVIVGVLGKIFGKVVETPVLTSQGADV